MRQGPTLLLLMLLALSLASTVRAQTPELLADLSLEQLLEVRVARVDTDLRQLSGEAAAIFVLSGDEIRRSGATALPEILRRVPGLHVGRYNKVGWGVSARGFNGDFADKMEVLLDGRRLQTPLYLGVEWGLHDTFIEDIERIEVIRGPGGALWGINAVNGVINIVTRSARDTQGHHGYAGIGNEEKVHAGYRVGGRSDAGMNYRLWAKTWNRDASVREDGSAAPDDSQRHRGGFRMDWGNPKEDAFNLQGDGWQGSKHDRDLVFDPAQPPRDNPVKDRYYGLNVLGRWTRQLGEGEDFRVQLYWDHVYRKAAALGDWRNSFDLSFAHQFRWGDRHQISWGGGYLSSRDRVASSFSVAVTPTDERLDYPRLYVQDRISFFDEQFFVTAGAKFQLNDYTDFEIQPNLRALFKLNPEQEVWAAISRAVREPSRLDTGVRFIAQEAAPATFVAVVGDPTFQSEVLWAYELGYRWTAGSAWSVDIATFFNDYEKLRSFQGPGDPFVADGAVFLPITISNSNAAQTHGVEIAAHWQALPTLRLGGGYSSFRIHLTQDPGSQPSNINATEGSDPRHQAFLNGHWTLHPRVEANGSLRYVDRLPALAVSGYAELDLRVAWRFRPAWQLALTGNNLLHEARVQYTGAVSPNQRNAMQREGRLEVIWHP